MEEYIWLKVEVIRNVRVKKKGVKGVSKQLQGILKKSVNGFGKMTARRQWQE